MRCDNGLFLGLLAVPFSLAWSALPTNSAATLLREKSLGIDNRVGGQVVITNTNQQKDLSLLKSSVLKMSGGGNQERKNDSLTQSQRRRRNLSVSAVLASAFLNLLGFTMAGPITPALGQHFDLTVGASFGSLTSAYPLGMLLGLFVWPQLSDNSKIGRKPVMCASLLGSGLGLVAQAYVIQSHMSLLVFLLTRVLTGCFAGSSPVSKAYLADVGASEGQLPRYLAWRDAASTLAFIVGPLLGGLAYDARKHIVTLTDKIIHHGTTTATETTMSASASLAFVISISAAASLAAAALVGLGVSEKEVEGSKKKQKQSNADATSSSSSKNDLLMCPLGQRLWTGVATVCVVSFLFNVGDSTFHAFFSALMRDNLGLDPKSIGLSYTFFACISFCMSATTASRLVKQWGPVTTCVAGLSAIGTGLLALATSCTSSFYGVGHQPLFVLGAAALYYCGVPLYGPTIPTMLLRCVPPNRRGAVMGLDGAINTVGRVIAPLVMGELYRRCGPATTFGLAGTIVFGAAITALTRRLVVMRDLKLA